MTTTGIIEYITLTRKERKLTQADLAKVIGVSETTYRQKENGQKRFYLDEVEKIFEVLDLELDVLESIQKSVDEAFEVASKDLIKEINEFYDDAINALTNHGNFTSIDEYLGFHMIPSRIPKSNAEKLTVAIATFKKDKKS